MIMASEVRLAVACARVSLAERDRAEVRGCLDGPIDWGRLVRLARWHGLRPLLHRHLSDCEGVPRAVLVELWAETETIARRNRAMTAELDRILGRFDSMGLRAVPYKGPTLALRAYGELGLREFGDLDILVPRSQVQRARDALCAIGYVPEYALQPAIEQAFLDSHAQYHLVLRAPEAGHLVELHWKSDPDYPVEHLEDERWWAGARGVEGAAALGDEDLLLVLCIHGSKHFWSSLGWLVDVAEILRRPGEIDWSRFVARAVAMGAARRVGVGLRLAADVLDAPLPPACRVLAARPDVMRLAAAIGPAMLAAEPGPMSRWQAMRLQRALHGTWFLGIRDLLRAVCLPSLVEWTRWPLPKPLFFAYPALRMGRLAGKYLRRGLQAASGGRKLQS